MAIRFLVVDDFEDWRRQICVLLAAQPESQVVAEASDGLEAVKRAEALKPDLVVLDIGLPKLNGIEAAVQILRLSPGSKLIFLSAENSADVVQKALETGASGYVRKMDAQRELLPAIDAVLRGRHFVSEGLEGHTFTDGESLSVSLRLP